MATYDVGDVVRLEATVTTSTGAINSSMTLVINGPSPSTKVVRRAPTTGSTAITNSTVGEWYYDLFLEYPGRWTYQWRSTGTVRASEAGAFAVRKPRATT